MPENVKWVQTPAGTSWHIVKSSWVFANQVVKSTYCGRSTTRVSVDDRPPADKTCETCLRIAGPR